MKLRTGSLCLSALSLIALAAPAQETAWQSSHSRFVSLTELVDLDVVWSPTPETVGTDAAERGSVKDLVVAAKTGSIVAFALTTADWVEPEDKLVLVPIKFLTYERVSGKPRFRLTMPEPELTYLREFDLQGARGDRRSMRDRLGGMDPLGSSMFATTISGARFRAKDGAFGRIRDAAVDTRDLEVAYLLVDQRRTGAAEKTTYVVPFAATERTTHAAQLALKVQKTRNQLRSSIIYRRPASGILTLEIARRADAFFGTMRRVDDNPPTHSSGAAQRQP